ncbi:DUF5753 domain-containing protein [Streptomyces sp. NPDC001822]|uniref:DUF5753 domain-containing protein n=1 Tax=Streptomyces sp. NPDC001822 TaxID=3364614 RepID=UPI00368214A2
MLKVSKSTVSRLENTGPIPAALPALLDEVFRTDGKFKRLAEQTVAASFPELYRRRMELERGAVQIWEWSPTIIPGLLQTEPYAHALLRAGSPRATEQEIAAEAAKRIARQGVLRSEAPPDLRVVLCESVLMRQVAAPEVMAEQLGSLLAHMRRSTTSIQVLPLSAEPHTLIDSAATLLTAPTLATVVYVETYRMTGIVEDPEHVRAAVRTFESLLSEAHSVRRSADIIREQMEKL